MNRSRAAARGTPGTVAEQVFAGASATAARLRAHDWSSTALGPADAWPAHLRAALGVCFASPLPNLLCWGTGSLLLGNDAVAALLGAAPEAVVAAGPAAPVWLPVWPVLAPLIETVRCQAQAVLLPDAALSLPCEAGQREACVTVALNPCVDAHGTVDGVLCVFIDTTTGQIARRRLEALHALALATAETRSADAACRRAADVLARHPRDVAFAAIYLRDATADGLALAATGGLGLAPGLPARIGAEESAALPAAIAGGLRDAGRLDLAALGVTLPGGAWPEPARTALALPLRPDAQAGAIGVLLLGFSPRSASAAACATFFAQAAAQIGAAVGEARAYEAERRRVAALAELDRAKTAFFSNVSHEFRTPLTLLLAPLEEAVASLPPDAAGPLRGLLDTAQRNALRLLRLVNALLDFARLEAGRVRARFRRTDLAAVTADLASVFRSAIERAGLEFAVQCAPLPEAVWVDREMWEKIVLNLLSNALKFTFSGRIAVSLQALPGGAVLEVRDTGIGIAAEELPQLFQRFHRIESARARSAEGSGIGLALVQELARMHGGEVTVQSRPGAGSCFRVRVPFGHAHLPADHVDATGELPPQRRRTPHLADDALRWLPSAPAAVSAPEAHGADAARTRILVADDNAELRDYLVRLLGARWTVEAVADGEAALAALRRRRFDLVLSDVMMPRLDGYGLLRVLRSDPVLEATPVILLSALADKDACVEGLQHGADDYLIKPFSASEVVARVGAHLKFAARRGLAAANAALLRLHEVGMRPASRDTMPDLLQAVVEAAVATADAGMGLLQIIEPSTQAPQVAAQYGFGAEARASLDGLAQALPPGRERLIVEDVSVGAPAGAQAAELLRAAGVHAAQSTPILARDGRLLGTIATCWTRPHRPDDGVLRIVDLLAREAADLIDHHEREQALQEIRATLQSFYDSSPFMMGVAELDGDTPVGIYANAAMARFFAAGGATDGAFPRTGATPKTRALWLARYRESLREERPVRFEYEHPEPGGGLWLSATVAQLGAGRAGRPRFSFVIEDVSERKRQEHALRDADRRKDEFLAMLAHELRNPLLPIVTALELIRRRGNGRFGAEYATIEQQVRHVVHLVDDLLDVARIARGGLALNRQPLSLRDAVDQAVRMVAPLLQQRGHVLDVQVPPLTLRADAARLAQIVANLLTNAAKYTPHGGRIAVQARDRDGQIVLDVRDNGIGIERDALSRVFDTFSPARRDAAPEGAGLGLGLSIVRKLVELHGGTVQAHSDGAGHGSVFRVRLPAGAGTAADPTEAVPALPLATARPQRILVVDDNDAAREGIAELLRAVGHEVTSAPDGAAGIAAALQLQPDIAILDIGLPQMDGYEVARRLRALPGAATPRLIALTGYGREPDLQRGHEAGFALYLTKPLLDRLIETIEAWGREASDRTQE
jgi:signal transduction histidine kinase/DNA-binding response OmpR family regulator